MVLNEDRFPEGLPEDITTRQLINGFFGHMVKSFPSEVRWGLVYKMAPGTALFINQGMVSTAGGFTARIERCHNLIKTDTLAPSSDNVVRD